MLFQCITILWCLLTVSTIAQSTNYRPLQIDDFLVNTGNNGDGLQDVVTYDKRSLFVRGERILIWSGEFHPFRLPVPGLWLDVFQKIKALGYNAVSFYVSWSQLEGKQGDMRVDGIFNLEPFFEAASQAGIYLIARPGPYINAEVSGGGFPGWLSRNPAYYRTRDPEYLNATQNYMSTIGGILANAQVTNGGPIILVQPENEYTVANTTSDPEFPDPVYWEYVMNQLRNAGVKVPLISNDAYPAGHFAPGPPAQAGAVNIYGHDGYPLGFDCSHPNYWGPNYLPTNFLDLHLEQSSSTPYSIMEFQGGSFDQYAGPGFEKCVALLGSAFERVFYKNNFSFGLAILNVYMTYGGTNWGHQAVPGTYTSYDYGSVIAEDRTVSRQKYSEVKLIAQFMQASAVSFLESIPQNNSNAAGAYTGNADMFITTLIGKPTRYYVIRHTDYASVKNTQYRVTIPIEGTNITVPQLKGNLTLFGRDSKFLVTEYDLAGQTLLYSTAEIFTWKRYGNQRVLVVYTGPGETNELAVQKGGSAKLVEGSGVTIASRGSATVLNFPTDSNRRVVQFSSGLTIHILDRASAYDYWVVDLPNDPVSGNFTNYTRALSSPIIKAGVLLRTAEIDGTSMKLTGDILGSTPLEVIGGAPKGLKQLSFNGEQLKITRTAYGTVQAQVAYKKLTPQLPDLSSINWRMMDSLPEVQPQYDDSLWPMASLTYSNRTTIQNLTTPTSLFSSDYGFHYGFLIYRGHFVAAGNETEISLDTQGGQANAYSVWLNSTFIGSWIGGWETDTMSKTFKFPRLAKGKKYVFTIVLDSTSLDENYDPGENNLQDPRGILDYDLSGRNQSSITWKLTGNFDGENYIDKVRGPLNEGGLFAERHGYHLPGTPSKVWKTVKGGPMTGIKTAGVAFYSTDIKLDLPTGYHIPLSVNFINGTAERSVNYRCQFFVNGYQFGTYVNNMGPQTSYPVPEGIWNYRGINTIAVSLFALDAAGARIDSLAIEAGPVIQTSFQLAQLSPMPGWTARKGVY